MSYISKQGEPSVDAPIPNSGSDTLDGQPISSTNGGATRVQFNWFQNENTTLHHTTEYENDALVLRRGEAFKVGMTFESISFTEIMRTELRFKIETNSGELKSIKTRCPIVDKTDESKWGMEVIEKDPIRLHVVLKVNIPVNVIVGRYSVDVVVPPSTEFLTNSKIAILFNPWCKDDEVYLDDEEQRKEYVLNDTGLIYQGNSSYGLNGIMSKKWNYGQFEKNILDCVLRLLEKDRRSQRNPLKSLTKRRSCSWIARILSAMINSSDRQAGGGVIVGNWSGNYQGGVSPSSWNGSVEILQKYFANEEPVRYGQCWVFGGVMTTAFRALGIPARTVTNFASAHDTNESMTIDDFYDDQGNEIRHLSQDSIWNFHVWNEIWTTRKDLPGEKYNGWQVVDATPQERSLGLYQLGPAPLRAVKDGEIYAGFDTGFVFGEVNADYVMWVATMDKDDVIVFQKPTYRNTRLVGKYISTKMVGSDEREDLTHLYKYAEGSSQERKAFETAYSFGAGAVEWEGHFNVMAEGKDLTLDLKAEPTGIIPNGDDFKGIIVVKNTSQRTLTVNVTGVIRSVMYTGETKHLLKSKKSKNVAVGAGESVSLQIPVTVEEYVNKLTDLNCMRLVAVAKILETSELYVDTFEFQLANKDRIKVQFLDGELKVGQQSKVRVTFENSLPILLRNLVFTIEGAGITTPIKEYEDSLPSGEKKTKTFTIVPYKSGDRTLIVDIDSSEVKDFKSFVNVNVQPRN